MGIIKRLTAERALPPHRPARNFSGAAVNRLTASLSQMSASINSDLDGALTLLRTRARNLCANYEFGRRFLSLVANNVVGAKGPTLQVRATTQPGKLDKPANDAIETHWLNWSRRCDVTGRLSFSRLLAVCIKGIARDGEALVRVVRDRALPYGIGLQLLEPDRLDETYNARLTNGNVIRQGVELNSALKPVAYHIFSQHPGENYGAQVTRTRDRIPATDMYHLFLPERAEQIRGYTWMHAVLMRANMLSGYEEAAIVAARVGASKMGIFKRSADAAPGDLAPLADSEPVKNQLQISAEAGEFFDLTGMPGVELQSWDPDYPHQNYESFIKQCVRGLATGLDIATHNLSGDMTDVNYSSARIAELSERDAWCGLQEWMFDSFLLRFFREDWLPSALLRGDITFESGSALPAKRLQKFADASRFQGRRWDWVDPLKEAEAAKELIITGLSSRTEIAASKGREFDDVVEELAQEQKALIAAGLDPNLKSSPPKTPDKTSTPP